MDIANSFWGARIRLTWAIESQPGTLSIDKSSVNGSMMIDRGISIKRTVGICYLLASLYVVAGLLNSLIPTPYNLIPLVAIFAISFLIVWRMGFLKMEGLRGAKHK
jgi:hypothetical protein